MSSCELCLAVGEEYRFIAGNRDAFCVVCKAPLLSGHVLVMPKKHVLSLSELSEEERSNFVLLMEEMKKRVREKMNRDVIVVQNTGKHSSQEHVHFHILPTKAGLRELFAPYHSVPIRDDVSEIEMQKMRNKLI